MQNLIEYLEKRNIKFIFMFDTIFINECKGGDLYELIIYLANTSYYVQVKSEKLIINQI